MKIFAMIKPALMVIAHGSSLSKPGFWAHTGALTVFLLALRDVVKAVFPDAALISNDIVAHIAGAIGGLFGAYLMIASNKEAGIKLPPIELVAEPEPELPNEYHQKPEYRPEAVALKHNPIAGYQYPADDDARWMHKPKVQSVTESEFESVESHGFNDK